MLNLLTSSISANVINNLEENLTMNSNSRNVSGFNDVNAYLPKYQNALNYIVDEKQVMNGTSSTTFSPNQTISRCDAIVTFCRVFQANINDHKNKVNPFTDVPDNAYYTDYVKWAYYEGIVNGTSSTQFSPLVEIQRQGLCLIFVRYCTRFGVELPDNNDTMFKYADDASIGSYYKSAVYTLYRAGIISSGENNNFYPEMSMLRIYFCEFLFNYYDPFVPSTPFEIRLREVSSRSIEVTWPWMRGTAYEIRINNGYWYTVNNETYTFYGLNGVTPYTISLRVKQEYNNTTLYSGIIQRTITTDHRYYHHVENYFDLGYITFYGETENGSKQAINTYMSSVANRYLELFALRMTYDTQFYESSIDECKGTVTKNNIDTLCTHSSENHTTLYGCYGSVMNNFLIDTGGMADTTYAFWSCHKIQSSPEKSQEFNRSCSSGPRIYMIEQASPANRVLYSKGILMHELNHQLGAIDHYHELINADDMSSCKRDTDNGGTGYCSKKQCNKENQTIYRSEACIMNKSRQDISSSTIICEDCKSEILAYLDDNNYYN